MRLISHRGAHEVGGNCIELSSKNSTIIFDFGLPLNFSFDNEIKNFLPQPLINNIIQNKKSIDAILLSHPHIDHYGLMSELPEKVPVYCGKDSVKMMQASILMNPKLGLPVNLKTFTRMDRLKIGDFKITPYLMDHSGFDSYSFLIETDEKNIFYTGDFRAHGRKARLFDRLVDNPPTVDILITEGTTVGPRSDEVFATEKKLEERFVEVIKNAKHMVFVTAASQNIDRLVTIFKATRRTGRKFIIDPYTAEILDGLKDYPRLPKPSWKTIRVAYSRPISEKLEEAGRKDILEKHRKNGIKWDYINDRPNEFVILFRPSAIGPVKKYLNIDQAVWIYSMWQGYFEKSGSLRRVRKYFEDSGVTYEYLHTSGHAKLSDIKRLVEALKPETIIPIHSFYAEKFKEYFPNVRLINDGEIIKL